MLVLFVHGAHAPSTTASINNLMRKHDPILLWASRLLSPVAARDAGALYAWCRRLDELADDPDSDAAHKRNQFDEWASRYDDLCAGSPRDEFDAALGAEFGELCIFGQGTIARVNGVGIGQFGGTDNVSEASVAIFASGGSDADVLVGERYV